MSPRITIWHVTSHDPPLAPVVCKHAVTDVARDGTRLCAPCCDGTGWLNRRIEVDRTRAQTTGHEHAVITSTDAAGTEHATRVIMFEGQAPTTHEQALAFLASRGLNTFFGDSPPVPQPVRAHLRLRVNGGEPSADGWYAARPLRVTVTAQDESSSSPPSKSEPGRRQHETGARPPTGEPISVDEMMDEVVRRAAKKLDDFFARAAEEAARRQAERERRYRQATDNVLVLLRTSLDALGLSDVVDLPTPAQLKAAWRATARRTHPDAGGSAEKFKAAAAAYDYLRKTIGDEAGAA